MAAGQQPIIASSGHKGKPSPVLGSLLGGFVAPAMWNLALALGATAIGLPLARALPGFVRTKGRRAALGSGHLVYAFGVYTAHQHT